jgi:hypothetical protein
MAFSDARNERDRAETGKNSGNHGGGNAKDAERRNREAMSHNGPRASGMSSAAADHLVATGRVSTPSIPAGGVAKGNYQTQDQAYSDYARAVGKHATRGAFDKVADFLGGPLYDPKEPMAGNPRSFAGGDFHSTTNPGGVIGGLLGMGAGVPGLGLIGGTGWNMAGLPEIWHGGLDQPDLRNGLLGNTDNPMGGSMADIGGGHTYPSGGAPGGGWAGVNSPQPGGGTGNGGQWAQGPMAPKPGQVTPAAAAAPLGAAGQQPTTMGMGPMNLSVPGPSQYGLMLPGYRWNV